MKKLLALLCVATMILSLSACGGEPQTDLQEPNTESSQPGEQKEDGEKTASAKDKDTLVFISHMTSETLDPLTTASSSGVDKNAMHQIFDCLLQFDNEGTPIPCLAESWEDADDGRAVIFHLRKDVKFHDGTPFNADAVVYTFNKQFENPLTSYITTYYTACEKVDDYSVKITKATPHVALLSMMAEGPFIVSPTAYEKGAEQFAKNPIGTGAYKFESQGTDQYVHLTANEEYFDGAPYYKKVIIRTPVDSSTAVVALQNGEADIAINLTPNQLALVKEDPNLVAEVNTGWAIKYLNFYAEPLKSDENLRKAIYYAINRENAAMFNNEPETIASTTLYPTRVMGDYVSLQTVDGYNVEKAKEYLAQSNYDGETLKLYISANEASIAQSVQADLQMIGINVEIVQLDTNAYYAKFTDGTCQMVILDFGTDQLSTEDMLNFYSTSGYYGQCVYTTPEYDALMEKINAEYNAEARKELVKEALEMQYGFYNMVPMYESYFNFIHRAELTGFNPVSGANYVYYLGKVKPADA